MSDVSNYNIADKIISVKHQGFRAGFMNPFSYQVTVVSEESKFPFHTHTAVFTLKNPDDARTLLDNVGKNPNLRAKIIEKGNEIIVAKAIELLDKSQKQGTGPFDPNAERYTAEKRNEMNKWDTSLEYGRKGVEQEKRKDRTMVERIAAMPEYKNNDKVRDSALAMGAKVPPKQEGILVKVPNKTIPENRRKLNEAAGF